MENQAEKKPEKSLFEAGKNLKKEGKLEEATEKYLEALKINPDYLPVIEELADLSEKKKNWEQAITYYQRIREIAPKNSLAQAKLARVYQRKGQVEKAGENYQQALDLNPELPGWVYKELGEIWENQGKLEAACNLYEQAITNNSASLFIYKKRGETLEKLGKDAEAREAYKAAIKKYCQYLEDNSDNLGALEQLAGIYESTQEFNLAAICYQRVVEKQPENALTHGKLARCYSILGEEKKAVEEYQKATEITDKLPAWVYSGVGDVLEKQGELEKAGSAWLKAIELEPEQPPITYQKLGEVLWQLKKVNEAASCWEKAAQLYPGKALFHFCLGQAKAEQKQWEAAVEAYQKAIIRKHDYSWEVHHFLGEALLKLQRWQAAASAFQQAISLKPDTAISYCYLGDALVAQEDLEEAVASYRNAKKLQPDLPNIKVKLGKTLEQLLNLQLGADWHWYLKHNPEVEIKTEEAGFYLEVGKTLAKHCRLEGAIAFARMALNLREDYSEAQSLLQEVNEKKARLRKAFEQVSTVEPDYSMWLRCSLPKFSAIEKMVETVESFQFKPLISIIVPTYNTPEQFLREMIQSVQDQIYPYWELCIADDASPKSHVKEILKEYAAADSRIKVVFREKNGHICAASNSALELATGEYIALLDHDDLLPPDSLYEVVRLLNAHPEADMIYTDEDKMNEDGRRGQPYFKPDWCPDSFLSRMYTSHLGVYRHSMIKAIAGFREGFEGSQDYDLVLRVTEKTNNIFHIPKVLYHWRIHSESTAGAGEAKLYAFEAGARAIEEALTRREEPGRAIINQKILGVYTVKYKITEPKLVSIIIPTRNLGAVLDTCLESIFDKTLYRNFEIIVVDNGTDEPETMDIFADWERREPKRFKVHRYDIPFNYSKLNNYGISKAKGDYLLFLNNDTEVITSGWMKSMVEQVQRPSIGAVGALLLYPDDTVQHAGVVLGLGGVAGHSHKHFPGESQGYNRHLVTTNNYSAVTAACLMCRREVCEEVGGFDETLQVAFNDIDFCLKIKSKGYNNICLPHVKLYHFESKSRGYEDTPEKQRRFQQEIEKMQSRWSELFANDPCYSPNLTRDREDYSLRGLIGVEVLEVSQAQLNQELLWGCSIDLPRIGRYNGPIDIGGWVVTRKSKVSKVEVLYAGEVVKEVNFNYLRPDVASVFPHVPDADKSGFIAHLDLQLLPEEAELDVRTILEDGTAIELGKVRFTIKPGN